MEKIEKLKKILEISSRDTISAKEIEKFLLLVLNTIKEEKDSFKNISDEQFQKIEESISFIESRKAELSTLVDSKAKDVKSLFSQEIDEAKNLLKTIAKIKATPGKDGKDYVLTNLDKEEIASLIEVPIVEKVIEKTETIKEVAVKDTPDQIVEKINQSELVIDSARIDGYTDEVKTLQNRTQLLVQITDGLRRAGSSGGINGSGTTNQVAYWGAPGVVAGNDGLTYNTSILTITNDALGSNTSDTKGLALVNTTSATSLLNQVSPAIKFKGNGWKTNTTAASQLVEGRIYLNVLTGTANPQGAMRIQTALNGGSFASHVFDVWSDGIVSIEEGGPFPSGYAKLQIPSINITSGGSIRLAESKGASGQFLGSDGTKTIWATPTLSLSNGSATTANGSAVDLGGLATGNISINMASFNIQFVGGNLNSDPNDFLTYGTYTPTWSDETNTSSITAYPCQWMRVGNTVTVSGKVDITATSASTDTQARATLPVSTTLGNDYELAGAFNCGEASGGTVPAPSGVCFANTARSELMVKFFPIDTDSHSYFFTYTYQIIIA